MNHQEVFLKKNFYQNDWSFDSELKDDLIHKSKKKKMKIDLILKDFAEKKIFKNNIQSRIEKQKMKIEHQKSKIVVWNLTAVSQRFKIQIQKTKIESIRNLNRCSVDWKAI